MGQSRIPSIVRPGARWWWAAAVVLAVLATIFILAGGNARQTYLAAAPSSAPNTSPESQATRPPAARTRVSRPPATPTHLRIPAIDVAADVTGLGLNGDNTVEVPEEPHEAGWFNRGPTPGLRGSSVILGHVDSTHGPAVFYRLRHLEPGDRVHVRLSNGDTAHFAVARVATYANEKFPAQQVYAGSPRRPALNLVTCGGAYDPDAGGYQANVVVYTAYLHTTPSSIATTPQTR